MDNKRLNAFVKSAELGSLSAAAEELGYTPSAVSQLVASLESEFGFQLLVRTTRGVYATPEAAGLIPIVRDYLSREQLIYDYVYGINNLSGGTLTITAYPSIATNWLPDIVSEFTSDYPDVTINILEGIRSDLFRQIESGDAELAFLAYAEPMPYEWIPLAEQELVAVLPENHPLADRDSFPISAVQDENFILSSSGREPEILNMLAKHNIHPEIKYTTYETPVNLAMVQRGLGVSICNELSVKHWRGPIVRKPLDPPEKVTFGIACKSYDSLSAAARKFLDYSVRSLTREEE